MFASNYFENTMLNLMRGISISAPSKLYLALFFSNPGETGSEGTEAAYTGYTRKEIKFGEITGAGGTTLSMSNESEIVFTESASSAGIVSHVGVFDSLTAGNLWLYGELAERLNIQQGVTPIFRANSITWIWSGNLSDYYRRAIMNVLKGTSCSGFSPYIGLLEGTSVSSLNEFEGNNYERIPFTMSAPSQTETGPAQCQNTTEIISNISTGYWGELSYAGIYDAASSGNAYAYIPLGRTYSMLLGTAAGFHAGNLKFSID